MRRFVRVQTEAFDVGAETARLCGGDTDIGAVASFIGQVRSDNLVDSESAAIEAMTLEHYPGMTEKALERIIDAAACRWMLHAVTVIHRVGELHPGDPIVLVLTASSHRREALEACEFIMDILKTQAPFWKRERLSDGSERWVEARDSDNDAAARWLSSGEAAPSGG